MEIEKALQVIKQAIDAGIKLGVCPNLETSAVLSEAWRTLINALNSAKEK